MTVARILDKKGYKVFSIGEALPVRAIVDELARNRIGVLIVKNAQGDGVGIVSERDVIAELSSNFDSRKTAGELMTHSLVRCALDDTEGDIMERMGKAGVRHLPVQHGGRLVGLVSARDHLNLRIEKLNELMADIRSAAAKQLP
ncbi:MAG: CBS domain-containing protein [Hyphomicrobiales bacterium]